MGAPAFAIALIWQSVHCCAPTAPTSLRMAVACDLGSAALGPPKHVSGRLFRVPLRCSIHVAPNTGDNVNERYVDTACRFSGDTAVLEAEKGLGDARAEDLLRRMAVEGRDMAGDMMLAHLCGVAKTPMHVDERTRRWVLWALIHDAQQRTALSPIGRPFRLVATAEFRQFFSCGWTPKGAMQCVDEFSL